MAKQLIFISLCVICFPCLSFASTDTIQWIANLDSVENICRETTQEYKMIQIAKKSNALIRDFYGEQSEEYLQSLLHLSELYQERMEYSTSNSYHHMAYTPYMEKIRFEFSEKSENDKVIYWQTASKYFDKTLSIAYNTARKQRFDDGGEMAAAAYDALLLYKGLLLNLSRDFEHYVNTYGNDEEKKLWDYRERAQAMGLSKLQDSLDYIIIQKLKARNQKYHVPNLSITWQQVQQGLQKEDLAIEFFQNQNGQYAAVLIRRGWRSPKIVRLGKLPKVDKVRPTIDSYISMYVSHDKSFPQEKLENAISTVIWPNALLQYFPVEKNGRVFFSTDGMLSQIGIEYLPFEGKKYGDNGGSYYSMSDAFEMHRLSSTRQLVMTPELYAVDSAVIYGGIQYDADEDDLLRESFNYRSANQFISHYSLLDNFFKFFKSQVRYLPGTKLEAECLTGILKKNNIPSKFYYSDNAVEESFYSLTGKHYSLLHFGTHGFYYPISGVEPLSSCGLLMTGANITLSGFGAGLPTEVHDGVLTAREISLVDLQGCDLAVLSACETAKGKVDSEGVWGLQRSFKMAGVNSIIMSLWKVDDQVTQLLMSEFYSNWIDKKQSKHDALKNAQNKIRFLKNDLGVCIYSNPIFWAGFVLLD